MDYNFFHFFLQNFQKVYFEIKKYYNIYIRMTKLTYYETLKKELGDFNKYDYIGKFKNKSNNEKNNYLKAIELSEDIILPQFTNYCKCGHYIEVQCYIRNIQTKEIFVVGNCCVKKFGIKKKCIECNEVHKRTKFNICTNCEQLQKNKIKELKEEQKIKIEQEKEYFKNLKKLENSIITFGKYKYKTIKYVYDNDIDYINWCLKQDNKLLFDKIIQYNKLIN